nr:hypothetical protein [Tanacetum cinerariifolium]
MINVDLFNCGTPLGVIFNKFSRLSSMEDDLFSYKVGVHEDSYFPCVEQLYDDLENRNLNIYELRQCYDENERIFVEAVILINNELLYWIRGDDEEVLSDDEFSDLEKEILHEGNEIAEIFKIEMNIFLFETTLCEEFNEFNHLLWIDVDVLTGDLPGFKTYEEYKNTWYYEWNNEVTWVDEKPCLLVTGEKMDIVIELEEYWWEKKEEEESSEDAWSNNLPNDEWEHCEHFTYIKTDREKAAPVATNARQCKRKLHGIVLTTSFTSQDFQRLNVLNLDQLEKQLDKEEFEETGSVDAFRALKTQFQLLINFRYYFDDDEGLMIRKYFLLYTQTETKEGNVDSSKALDASLVVTKCNGTKSDKHDTSSSSGNYITRVVDADIRPVNDQVPFAEEESFQSNKPCKNQNTPKFREFFEINELKAQLQAKNSTTSNLKKQIKNVHEKSNEANVKHDIDVTVTINIKVEHKVAKLLKENKTLKKHYKDLSTSEKGVYNYSIKNELRKLIGNSVNTKFAKPSILGKLVLQPLRNQSVVRQPIAFRSERPKFSKPQFASQVNVKNDLPKPVTPHYLPKVRESMFVKPHHVITSGSSRNSSKESYGSNDIAHKYYLEEAKKKTQDKNTNLKPRVMHTTSLQNTTNSSKPNLRSTNQIYRSLPVSKSSCEMSNGVPLIDHSTLFGLQTLYLLDLSKMYL